MQLLVYDGSFNGLLTAVFEVYEYKLTSPFICKESTAVTSLFGTVHNVITSIEKSERVLKKLEQKFSKNGLTQLYKTFLSELKDIENVLLRYIQLALSSKLPVENNYSNADVLMVQNTSRKVHREKHRMEAFVRFQLTKDQLYYAVVQPDFNVLPLIAKHFKQRYADQRWLIYDGQRKYGLYYDLQHVTEVQINFDESLNNPQHQTDIYDEQEEMYQQLWKQYFSSVNIKARKNTKLHIQHMPKRYWKYLIEKQPA
jgi:probable DNA metabolism protein